MNKSKNTYLNFFSRVKIFLNKIPDATFGISDQLQSSDKKLHFNIIDSTNPDYRIDIPCELNVKLFKHALKVVKNMQGAEPKLIWNFIYAVAKLQFIDPLVRDLFFKKLHWICYVGTLFWGPEKTQ